MILLFVDINEVLKFDPTNDEVLCLKKKAEDASNKQNACNQGTKDCDEASLEMGKPTEALKGTFENSNAEVAYVHF